MKPTLNTLSDAYIVLDDLNLTGLLSGGDLTLKAGELIRELLREKKLHLFVAALTGKTEQECGELELTEAVDEITSFFVHSAEALHLLLASVTEAIQSPVRSEA